MKPIRDWIDAEVEHATAERIAQDHKSSDVDGDIKGDILTSFEGHVKLGTLRPLKTILKITSKHAQCLKVQSSPVFLLFLERPVLDRT